MIRTGRDGAGVCWDIASGYQFYNEYSHVAGFKAGPIRAVQRKLDLLTLAEVPLQATDLPSQTVDRIIYFTERGRIPPTLAEPLAESYSWFLQRYHQVQEKYKNTRQSASISFCQEDFEQHIATIWAFIG